MGSQERGQRHAGGSGSLGHVLLLGPAHNGGCTKASSIRVQARRGSRATVASLANIPATHQRGGRRPWGLHQTIWVRCKRSRRPGEPRKPGVPLTCGPAGEGQALNCHGGRHRADECIPGCVLGTGWLLGGPGARLSYRYPCPGAKPGRVKWNLCAVFLHGDVRPIYAGEGRCNWEQAAATAAAPRRCHGRRRPLSPCDWVRLTPLTPLTPPARVQHPHPRQSPPRNRLRRRCRPPPPCTRPGDAPISSTAHMPLPLWIGHAPMPR